MLAKVEISAQVHMLCSTYALCTDVEEVAMVLVGSFKEYEGNYTAYVESVLFTIRKDKKKDRVEISSEQLSEAMTRAEEMGLVIVM
jgi:BRCA1/BRCA2-containing complex subunit 3